MRNVRERGEGKLIVIGAIALIAVVIIGGVTCAKLEHIPPGSVGVSVKKCGKGGVGPDPIPVGYYWRELFCEEVIKYPTNLQTLILTKAAHEGSKNDDSITVTSSQGMAINVDVSLSFTLDSAKVPKLYEKFKQDVGHLKDTFVRQTVREALQATFSKYTAEELYSTKREVARAEVQNLLISDLAEWGFVVVQFTINETRVPEQVVQAINAKIAMMQDAQRAEQEVKKKEFEAAQKVAVAKGDADAMKTQAEGEATAITLRAEAQAKANKILAESITPALIEYEKAQKWNGTLPQVTGGGTIPMIQVK